MDPLVGYAAVGVAASGAAGFLACRGLLAGRNRRLRAAAPIEGAGPGGARWLRRLASRGAGPLLPLASALLRNRAVSRWADGLVRLCRSRGLATQPAPAVSAALVLGIVAVGGGWVLTGSPVFGAALAGCAVVAVGGLSRAEEDRCRAALRDEVPDALRSLGVCFRAGLSLVQTLRQTGTEMKGPLGELFLSAACVLETGGTAGESLAVFRRRADVPELAFVAVALDVQHACGGSIAPVLDAARESVEGEIELARSLRVQTAQAKLSARIVTAMPFILVALFSLMSPGFLAPFVESVPGMVLLAMALAMQVAGIVAVRRLLDVDGR
ncbi:type II secretion system F family protein [uncultured Adlercreutzia sp.]|uniref:type II secretion system F family protein n=1 Tax=uncultured Adlercreutzia sp. TaxID=875803 RepID=UPI0026771348|nr:type II secretion system F family protein [uncultured Adlercreutzia sp.]